MFAIMVPHARRWRNGGTLERIPWRFPNADLFERFFRELAHTSGKLCLDLPSRPAFHYDPGHFWRLEAVRRCATLQVNCLPRRPGWALTSQRIIWWLSLPSPGTPRRLQTDYSRLARSASELVDDLVAVSSLTLKCSCVSGLTPRHDYRRTYPHFRISSPTLGQQSLIASRSPLAVHPTDEKRTKTPEQTRSSGSRPMILDWKLFALNQSDLSIHLSQSIS